MEGTVSDVHEIIDTFGPTGRLMADVFISNVDCLDKGEYLKEETRRYGEEIYALSGRAKVS